MRRKQFGQYTVFNPPAYYQQMAVDPTQIPQQQYPYGGGPPSPYGPYPGFMLGQRSIDYADADRINKERAQALVIRSETSNNPEDIYIAPEGRLTPVVAATLQRAKQQAIIQQDPLKSLQQKIFLSILVGSIVSALLK